MHPSEAEHEAELLCEDNTEVYEQDYEASKMTGLQLFVEQRVSTSIWKIVEVVDWRYTFFSWLVNANALHTH